MFELLIGLASKKASYLSIINETVESVTSSIGFSSIAFKAFVTDSDELKTLTKTW
jgi:hypothetical protein